MNIFYLLLLPIFKVKLLLYNQAALPISAEERLWSFSWTKCSEPNVLSLNPPLGRYKKVEYLSVAFYEWKIFYLSEVHYTFHPNIEIVFFVGLCSSNIERVFVMGRLTWSKDLHPESRRGW